MAMESSTFLEEATSEAMVEVMVWAKSMALVVAMALLIQVFALELSSKHYLVEEMKLVESATSIDVVRRQ